MTTRRQGIAVTKPARTLRDLRRSVTQPVYRRAVRRALDLGLISSAKLAREPDLTRSQLERSFLRLCRRHRLPAPEVNSRVGPYEVDFLWRDAELQSLGYRVLRFTYRQVNETPQGVAASLRALVSPP
jgi:hypothetical protein